MWLRGALIVALSTVVGVVVLAQAPVLDFATYKSRVEPILLAKHDGYARCYVCHSQGTNFRLQRLADGAVAYTEAQSRQNFQAVQRLVTAGNPITSRLLLMPLAHEAGGTEFHPGGKRWTSQSNAEWRAIADWVRGR
jgi:hypothetical protein